MLVAILINDIRTNSPDKVSQSSVINVGLSDLRKIGREIGTLEGFKVTLSKFGQSKKLKNIS